MGGLDRHRRILGGVMGRRVILLCGPPASGKTTLANSPVFEGLTVFDVDEPPWFGDEMLFGLALRQIGETPDAQAIVIRSGSTLMARKKTADLVKATETIVLMVDEKTCVDRVVRRGRLNIPIARQIAGVRYWWKNFEPEPKRNSRDW